MTQPVSTQNAPGLEESITANLPALYRSALALSGNRVIAEDLVHDSCVKALTVNRKPGEVVENSAAWLYKILVNTFRDYCRRENNSPFLNANDEYENVIRFLPGAGVNPESELVKKDFERTLQMTISSLPDKIRTVIVLNLVSGCSYRDISVIAECPLGTVMSRLSRGKILLRESLKEFYPECHKTAIEDKMQI